MESQTIVMNNIIKIYAKSKWYLRSDFNPYDVCSFHTSKFQRCTSTQSNNSTKVFRALFRDIKN